MILNRQKTQGIRVKSHMNDTKYGLKNGYNNTKI
jgi:hypothetical protein